MTSADEQQLAVLGQRPHLVVHDLFQAVDMPPDLVEVRGHGIVVGNSPGALLLDPVGAFAGFGHLGREPLNLPRVLLNPADQLHVGIGVERTPVLLHLHHLVNLVEQLRFVFRGDRHDVVHGQVAQHAPLDLDLLGVGLPFDLRPRLELAAGIDPRAVEHRHGLRVETAIDEPRCGDLAVESPATGLPHPLVRVAVAVEADGLAGADHPFELLSLIHI